MNKYPKMHLPYDKIVRQLPRVQNYIRDSKYWKNNNKCAEKKEFQSKILPTAMGRPFTLKS